MAEEKLTKYDIETKTVEMLRTVFDPEIPVNVYDLGLIRHRVSEHIIEDGLGELVIFFQLCLFLLDDTRKKVKF